MAVALAFRVAILLAVGGVRVLRWAEGPGAAQLERIPEWLIDRIRDPAESDEDLTAALSEWSGTLAEVATYAEPFELRKVQLSWLVDSGDVAGEDTRVTTFHFLKLAAGVPQSDWVQADFDLVSAQLAQFWLLLREYYPPTVDIDRIKFYKAGPDISPPQPPVYDADGGANPGTGAALMLPPQVALTVTEKAGEKKHWGRIYLPAPSAIATVLGTTGRVHATFQNAVADAYDSKMELIKAGNLLPVVYRPPLPVRQTAEEKRNGVLPGSLPARDGSAWSIDSITVDNVWDVIRSRRYDRPTSRSDRAMA